jgi:predicted TIM-barrel fold metal-dependent hydrolase
VAELPFQFVDADNHYYEAPDAFFRHLEPQYRKRGMQWIEVDGKRRLMLGGKLFRFIPNPTWDPIARPGSLDAYFRGKKPSGDVREAFGDLDKLDEHPEYQDRAARITVMDRQGMEACIMFPTLGVGVEEGLSHEPSLVAPTLRAFNRWLEDDWGYGTQGRIFGAPMVSLSDPAEATVEAKRVLDAGARVICMRAAPIRTASGGKSPGDPIYDPFWSLVEEAGATVAYHSGDAGYSKYADDWGKGDDMQAFRFDPFRSIITSDRPIMDTMAALVVHGVFARHPGVRVASIESGSGYVPELFKRFKKFYKQVPDAFAGDPIETFRSNIWVAPFYEDDLVKLAELIGVGHILMGSDWPHAEGLEDPSDFIHDLAGFSDADIKTVMRDNTLGLTVAA